jgi:hypothetical protein
MSIVQIGRFRRRHRHRRLSSLRPPNGNGVDDPWPYGLGHAGAKDADRKADTDKLCSWYVMELNQVGASELTKIGPGRLGQAPIRNRPA